MTPTEIFESLETAGRGRFPRQVLNEAVEQREAITPLLLDELRWQLDAGLEPAMDTPGYMRHMFAFYLLAYFREPAAYPLFVDSAALPGDVLLKSSGDMVTGDFNRQLAAVCHGDTNGIRQLIEDITLGEYVRSAALGALEILYLNEELERGWLVDYLRRTMAAWLAAAQRDGFRECDAWVWHGIIQIIVRLNLQELAPEARQALELDLAERTFDGELERFDQAMESQKGHSGLCFTPSKAESLPGHPVEEMQHWACFRASPQESHIPVHAGPSPWTSVRAGPKIGRNEPCPCGSGKKYKKCCGA